MITGAFPAGIRCGAALAARLRLVERAAESGAGIPVNSRCAGASDHSRREARYVNYFEIGVSQDEVVIDMGQSYGDGSPVTLHTRIVTGPAHARELARLLEQAMLADHGDREDR